MTRRVLVIDDHAPWRQMVRTLLHTATDAIVIDDVDNGADAEHAVAVTAPDLVLMDIDLPGMNGLEAARRILARAPSTRILFVSGHRSWDIVETAFARGGRGYVLKMHAGQELLPAIEAVLDDRRFVSAPFAGRSLDESTAGLAGERRHRHGAVFYTEPTLMLEDFADVAADALDAGQSVIATTMVERRDDLYRRLLARADVDRAVRQGRYRWMDAGLTAATLTDPGPFDATFWQTTIALVLQAARHSRHHPPRVVACGECAPEMLRRGNAAGALRIERLWDQVSAAFNVDSLCGYAALPSDQAALVADICAAHTSVLTR